MLRSFAARLARLGFILLALALALPVGLVLPWALALLSWVLAWAR